MALSPELTACIDAIYATFDRIKATFEESRRDHERFSIKMAEAQRRLDAVEAGHRV